MGIEEMAGEEIAAATGIANYSEAIK